MVQRVEDEDSSDESSEDDEREPLAKPKRLDNLILDEYRGESDKGYIRVPAIAGLDGIVLPII
jgi:hypothetical protein